MEGDLAGFIQNIILTSIMCSGLLRRVEVRYAGHRTQKSFYIEYDTY